MKWFRRAKQRDAGLGEVENFLQSLKRWKPQKDEYDENAKRRDYRRVFLSDDAGRRVLLDLFHEGYLLRTTFAVNPIETAFFEGCRGVALQILKNIDPQDVDLQQIATRDPRATDPWERPPR